MSSANTTQNANLDKYAASKTKVQQLAPLPTDTEEKQQLVTIKPSLWLTVKQLITTALSYLSRAITHVASSHTIINKIWTFVTFVAVCYNSFVIPFRISFLQADTNYWQFIMFDMIFDVIFWMDNFLQFFAPFIDRTELIRDKKRTAIKYLKTWFTLDFLSSIPLDWIAFLVTSVPAVLFRMNRLLRSSKLLGYYFGKLSTTLLNNAQIRMLRFLMIIVLVIHWDTCIWYLIHLQTQKDGGSADWLSAPNVMLNPRTDLFFKYTSGLYTVLVIMSGFDGKQPISDLQVLWCIASTLVGIVIYTSILGAVRAYIVNADSNAAQFQKKLDGITDLIKALNVNAKVRDKIMSYYDYLWKSRQGLDETKLLEELPDFLRIEVSLYLNRDIIEKVPLFKGVEKSFISEVVMNLKPRLCLPGSYIIRIGETGAEMYFMSRGKVEVIVGQPPNDKVVATLGEGAFFGEIALIYAMPRVASIRALTYCDLFVLTKKDFDLILEQYPEEARNILEEAKNRYSQLQKK